MISTCCYGSSLGDILLAADEVGLIGLWFEGQKYFANTLPVGHCAQTTPILAEAKRWLDIYFAGKEPDFLPPLHPVGSSFQQSAWKILLTVPYGQTITYGDIARRLAAQQGGRVSAQAVGGAVGHNKVSIIIPCHRVVGANGSLTGYAGGIDKKIKLLELEHADMSRLFIPKKGTALLATTKQPPAGVESSTRRGLSYYKVTACRPAAGRGLPAGPCSSRCTRP